jgi:hypothetical protein
VVSFVTEQVISDFGKYFFILFLTPAIGLLIDKRNFNQTSGG